MSALPSETFSDMNAAGLPCEQERHGRTRRDPLEAVNNQLDDHRDDDVHMNHYETVKAIAAQWRTEKFRERFGKPLFKGVFHDASMLPAA